MRPELEPPPFRLAHPLRWRWEQDPTHGRVAHLWSRTRESWSVQAEWTGRVHEALERGASFDELVVDATTHEPKSTTEALRRRIGTYLFQLRQEGYLTIDFPPPPSRFRAGLEPVRELGRGAAGVVWLARDKRLGDVVVKHPWDFFAPLDAATRHLQAEAQTLSALVHPDIVPLHDTFEDAAGLFHLVRGHVSGTSLSAWKAPGHGLAAVARRLVDILAHVHAQDYVLLDLAPGNFILGTDGTHPILIDVGTARRLENGTAQLPGPVGSPAYTAPEVRTQHRATPASDHYSLGRLLFALAAGRPPLAAWRSSDLAARTPAGPLGPLIVGLTAEDPAERLDLGSVRAALST